MGKRYVIWDKETTVITPTQEIFTPAQWIARYPAAAAIPTVCAAGDINGAFFDTLAQMKAVYGQAGADFTGCETPDDFIDAIEAFEDAQAEEAANAISNEERIAAALEAQVMLSLPDEA